MPIFYVLYKHSSNRIASNSLFTHSYEWVNREKFGQQKAAGSPAAFFI
jgi:hypothetical protein